jgi:hypothetical protein
VSAGHAIPTGVAISASVLDVTVTDATGKVILREGELGETGASLRPPACPRCSATATAAGCASGAMKDAECARIPPGGHRDERFNLPAGATYPRWMSG